VADPTNQAWRKSRKDEAGGVRTVRCAHAGQPRRRCELCDPARSVFLACSAACIVEHRQREHVPAAGAAAADTAAQVHANAAALNRARVGAEVYQHHRARLLRLLRAVQRGEGICILGAGNCDDLDLPALVRDFSRVHLVDIDGDAVEQAIARAPAAIRPWLSAQGGLDLSGTIALIDRWGDAYPTDKDLAAFVTETATTLAGAIGAQLPEPCDVVLSASLLSQLYLPVRDTLLLGMADWQKLFAAIDCAHLATLAALVRPGGTAVLALDVVSSHKLPELAAFADPATWDSLGPAVQAAITSRQIPLSPDPHRLLAYLAQPPLSLLTERARLTDPWVWTMGEGVLALVYGLLFSRVAS
jgi:hypothetical protein